MRFSSPFTKKQWVIRCYTPVSAKVNWILDPFTFLPSAIPRHFEWNQAPTGSVCFWVCERYKIKKNYLWLKCEFQKDKDMCLYFPWLWQTKTQNQTLIKKVFSMHTFYRILICESCKCIITYVRKGCLMLYLKHITNKDLLYSTGILLNVMWQPGWEGNLGTNRYMYRYGWVPSLLTWHHHNIVSQLLKNK